MQTCPKRFFIALFLHCETSLNLPLMGSAAGGVLQLTRYWKLDHSSS